MFETNRLIIRPYCHGDEYSVLKTINTYQIYKTTYGIPNNCDIRYAKRWVKNVINNAKENRSYEYAIIGKENKIYLGNVGLINIDFISRKCDISYFISPEFWGNGIATEASAELIKFALNRLDINRIGGICMEHNIGSARVMEKLMMKCEGILRSYFIKDNKIINAKMYSILKDEFIKLTSNIVN